MDKTKPTFNLTACNYKILSKDPRFLSSYVFSVSHTPCIYVMNSTRHTGGVPFFSHYSYLFCSFDEGLFTLYEKVPLLLLALNSFEKGAMSNQVIASFSKPPRIRQSKELDIFRMYTTNYRSVL